MTHDSEPTPRHRLIADLVAERGKTFDLEAQVARQRALLWEAHGYAIGQAKLPMNLVQRIERELDNRGAK